MIVYQPNCLSVALDHGGPVYLLPNHGVSRAFAGYDCGLPEQHLRQWALECLMPDGKVFVDIGANVGTWSLMFAASPKVGHVVAFEPQIPHERCLRAAAIINELEDRITLHPLALGAEPGMANLRVINEGGATSMCDLPTNRHPISLQPAEVCTLDSMLLSDVGFIKIDVEGAELDVLRGAVETLHANEWPKIIFEAWSTPWYEPRKLETFAFLERIGYRVIPVRNNPEQFLAERA